MALPKSADDLARICAATHKPVNALAAGPVYTALNRAEYAAYGVARISLGSALARATHRVIHDAANAILTEGDFTRLGNVLPGKVTDGFLR